MARDVTAACDGPAQNGRQPSSIAAGGDRESPVALLIVDRSGTINFANRAAEQIVGLDPGELAGKSLDAPEWQVTTEDGRPLPDAANPFIAMVRDGRPVEDARIAVRRPDGSRRTLSIHGAPVVDAGGGILRLVFSIIDISERQESVRRLAESDERLKLALGSARMGIWDWDLESHRVEWSDEVAPLFGLAPGEFGGSYEAYLELVHPEDRQRVHDVVRQTLRERETFFIEHRLVWPDGSVHWIEGRGRVLRDAAGRARRISGTVVDVTRRHRVGAELRASEEKYRSVVETTPGYILSVSRDHRISYINRALPDLDIAETLGRKVDELIREDYRESFAEALERVFVGGRIEELEVEARRTQDRSGWYLIRIGPVVREGVVVAATIVGIDLTDLKEVESQLRRAQRLESIGRLAGGVAHDFNNLLTAVLGYAELLQIELEDRPASRASAVQIRLAAERGARLTRKLLTFARKQVLAARVVDANRMIDDAGQLIRQLIGEDIEFVTRLDRGLPPVRIDPGQFEQVLINLAVNARDAMPSGGRLTVRSRRDPRRGGVTISVSDTGPGIPEAMLPHVFEPFFTTKPDGKGTGLGLSTCFGILKQSGGSIDARNLRNGGARFDVHLPAAGEPLAGDDRTAAVHPPRPGHERVLVVEDEPMVLGVVRRLLAGAGYRVVEAANAREALEIVGDDPGRFDLLITDVVMPGMNGAELATALLERDPRLKVLFMSGYPADSTSHDLLDVEQVHFIQKPFSPEAMSRKVRGILDEAG